MSDLTPDGRFFIVPDARTTAAPSPLSALLRHLGLHGLDELHGIELGSALEDLALTGTGTFAAIPVLEGLIVDLGCGFVATASGRGSVAPIEGRDRALLTTPVQELNLSVRAFKCFERERIRTIGDLIRRTESQMLRTHNFGRSTLGEVRAALKALGLDLGARAEPVPSDDERQPPALQDWPISPGSRERLRAAGIMSLEALAKQGERVMLTTNLVGLTELLVLADVLWRATGSTFAVERKRAARLRLDLNLLRRIGGLGWPRHVVEALRTMQFHTVRHVAAKGRRALVDGGLGEEDVDGIERALWRLGTGLGCQLDARVDAHAEELARIFAADLAEPPMPSSLSGTVEDELAQLLQGLGEERNLRVAARCLGWDGGGCVPDVRVAETFGLSRERVRQIRMGVLARFRAARAHKGLTPCLEAAIHLAEARVPAWASEIEHELVQKGLCRSPFRLEGLIHAAGERRIPVSFVLVEERGLRLAAPQGFEAEARVLLLRKAGGVAPAAPAPPVAAADHSGVGMAPNEAGRGSTTWDLAAWILARARERRLFPAVSAWSLIELNWQPAELDRLREWGEIGRVENPRELMRRRALGGTTVSGRDAVGLVFLAYAMEVGRRQAHEGELWPFVRSALAHELQERLFAEGSMLRPWVRDALESACPTLGLRHVFGQDGIQAWIRTVFLQFGVSAAGWERLPWWLSGHQSTVTIDDLLESDGPLHSPSFTALWKVLQQARYGHRNEARLRHDIEKLGSPWLMAGDIARVAAAALARPEVIRIGDDERATTDDDEPVAGLLAEPRLRWGAGDTPQFSVGLGADPSNWLKTGDYVLVLRGHARLPLTCDSDGCWHMPSEAVMLDLREPHVVLELLQSGVPVYQDELRLLDTDEEVLLFDLATGRPVDAWGALPRGRAVALLTRADLTVRPAPPRWISVFGGTWKLYRCDGGLASETAIGLGGETIWQPRWRGSLAPDPVGGRAWSEPREGRWGDSVRLRVELPPGLEPHAVRLGSHAYELSEAEARAVTILLDPTIKSTTRARVVATSGGRRTVVPVQLDLHTWGAARQWPGGRWQPIRPGDVLDPAELGRDRILVSAPMWGVAQGELALLEGQAFQARPRSVERGLGDALHGVGAPLFLCRGPYNRVAPAPVTLAAAVVRSGVVAAVRAECGQVVLILRATLDGTDEHAVWLWRRGQQSPTRVPWTRLRCEGREWGVLEEPAVPLACAVSYRGAWLGGRFVEWPTGPSELASIIEATDNWHSLALWLRWWRAPLLYGPLADAVGHRIDREPAPTLGAWLARPAGLPAELSLPAEDPAWQTVVQHFLWRWQPSERQAASLIAGLGLLSGDPINDLRNGWRAFDPLLSVHPVLLALIARDGMRALYPDASRDEAVRLLLVLRDRIAGLEDHADERDWRAARTRLLETAAQSMQVNSGFIEAGLLREARDLAAGRSPQHDNLRVALVVGPLRRFIAATLVHDFAQAMR